MKISTPQSQSMLRIAIVLAILLLLNVVSIRLFGRLDMTANGQYTLSGASRTLMQSLDDRVTATVYFSEELPSPYNNHRRMLLDQLNEYRAYARGNFQFTFIDPAGEKGERDAQAQGITPVQIQVLNDDRYEVKRAYLGMVLQYEDRREVLPVLQNPATLEYDISSTIRRLTVRTLKKIGFLSGHGEPPLTELGRVQEMLRRQYDMTAVNVAQGREVPADLAALVVMSPASRFTEPEKFALDQYLMRGGKVAFLLNAVDITLQSQAGRALDLNLDDLLAAYGLGLRQDLVRDVQCASVSIMQQQFGFQMQSQVPFPYLPNVASFSEGNPMVKDLRGVVLFFASSVDTLAPAARGLAAEVLMRSSKQSGRLTGMFTFDPLQRFAAADFPEHGIPLAAITQGRFRSAFAGKPAPADTSAGAPPPPAVPLAQSPETRVLLVGDGDFARDQYLGNRDNVTFFANMIDYLVDDAGLITIRSRDVSLPPLDQVSDGAKKSIKIAVLILPPLLVVGYGLLRWRFRKARRKALENP
jgi:gliding-associated putative ABC transporter substrate-binding component GldG